MNTGLNFISFANLSANWRLHKGKPDRVYLLYLIKRIFPCIKILKNYLDEGYKESDVDIEIQIAVLGKYENTENVVFKTVAPIQVASAVYKGGYDLITEANEAVAAWVSDNGYDYNGAMFCIYHVNPGHDPNPDNWVTEVCYPVKKA